MPLSVIIPTLDEESWIAATIDAAFAAGAAEVLVCDGGSRDATVAVARQHGARVLEGATMRARQLNRGAAEALHDQLVFLHADTLLPPNAARAIEEALGENVFGGFRLSFIESAKKLRIAEAMINLRTRFTRCPWGDQAQFISKARFAGFREIPLMEDYDLAVRMKRAGCTVVIPLYVKTSGRRFLRKGVLRTAAINWRIILAYRLGVSPERLARWYTSGTHDK